MNKPPGISIVVPVYNVEAYLDQCLDSARNQTFTDIEILCVDDGSEDGSAAILHRHAEEDGRVKILMQTNTGLSAARNAAYPLIRGRYTLFLDSDDFIEPELCEKTWRIAEAEQAEMVFFSYESRQPFVRGADLEAIVRRVGPAPLPGDLLNCVTVWSKLWRSDFLFAHRLFFPVGLYLEDLPVHWKALTNVRRLSVLPEKLYHYRTRSGSLTHGRNKAYKDVVKVFEVIRRDMLESGRYRGEWKRRFLEHKLWTQYSMFHGTAREYQDSLIREIRETLGEEERKFLHEKNSLPWHVRDFYDALAGRPIAKIKNAFNRRMRACSPVLRRCRTLFRTLGMPSSIRPSPSALPDSARERLVYSFDIFDTLITRKTATPAGIFMVMRERLRAMNRHSLPVDLIEAFDEYRIEAEKKAREAAGYREITLESIYERLHDSFRGRISREEIPFLRELEIETEMECSVPVSENIDRVRQLLDKGERVLLVSDMYLSAKVIRRLLEKTAPRLAELPLYLSCEFGKTKYHGDLFDEVCVREGIRPRRLVHVGDNERADVRIPRSKGIQAEHYCTSLSPVWEKGRLDEQDLLHQLAAGAVRRYRLSHPEAGPLEMLGAALLGPLLVGFVEDLLGKAERDGVERLYFLARDGQVLLRIAERIKAERGMNIDFRYLYCARQVCHFASLDRLDEQAFSWIIYKYLEDSFASVAERLHFDAGELWMLLPDSLRRRIGHIDRTLSERSACALKSFLLHDDAVRSRIETKAAEYRENFGAYLRQEGFFDTERVGIVDLGWTGKMQDALYKAARSFKKDFMLSGYYFFQIRLSSGTSPRNTKDAYSWMPKPPINPLEILLSADHGTTRGYTSGADGRMQPVLQKGGHLIRWGVRDLQRGAEGFVREYLEMTKSVPVFHLSPKPLLPFLLQSLDNPDRETAELLGTAPFSGDQNDAFLQEAAPPFSLVKLFRYHLFCNSRKQAHLTSWIAGSIARSSPAVRLFHEPLLELRRYLIRWVRFFRNLPRRFR